MLEKVNSQNISAKLKSNSNSFQNKKDSFLTFPYPLDPFESLISQGGAQSPSTNSDYNLKKSYEFVQLDVSSIQYNPGDDDYEQFRKIWNGHSPVKKVRNRIYSWFHSLKKDERNWLMIDGSHLTQAFDIKACNFCILGKLLENTDVDKSELGKYQKLMKEKYLYEEIAKFAGLEFTKELKDMLKKSSQHWLNIRKRWVNSGKNIDKYFDYVDTFFKNNFPSIYEIILNWRQENYLGKKSKMLWDDYQQVEFEIISEKMTNYLWKEYGVISLSVHDALYISMKDKNKIPESIEGLFWKILDYQFI